jgi:cytidine deaminase
MDKEKLMASADEARKLSYSPYSNFKVGAAILMKDGKIMQGANIENSAYGLCMCGERNALYHALMEGYKTEDMVALALCAQGDEPPYPCGACRQVLSELFPIDAPVIVFNESRSKVVETTVRELLPYAFGKDHLI